MSGYTRPATVNFDFYQGDRFRKKFELKSVNENTGVEEPFDLTPHTLQSHIKTNFSDVDFVPFIITIIDAANGEFEIALTSSTTRDMLAGTYVWDLEIIENNDLDDIWKLMVGQITLRDEVTVQTGP